MKRRLMAALLAAIMVFALIPVMVFQVSADVVEGDDDVINVFTDVDTSWKNIGPESTVTFIGTNGAFEGTYTSLYTNSMSAGVVIEVLGVDEDGVKISYDGYKASVGNAVGTGVVTSQIWSGYDKATIGTIPADGVYIITRQPQQWSQWGGMKYVRSLNTVAMKTDSACKVRLLGIVEVTSNDAISDASASVTYYGEDKETVLGTVDAAYGALGEWTAPKVISVTDNGSAYVPESYTDGDYTYTFSHWAEIEGDAEIAGAYANTSVYPVMNKKHKDDVTVTFNDESGLPLATVDVRKGSTVEYPLDDPEKALTYDYSYVFKGWVDENGDVVDLSQYTITEECTFTAAFVQDLRARVILEADPAELAAGSAFDLKIKLNRTDITLDADGNAEDITSGSITVKYNANVFTIEGGVDGVVEVPFSSVDEDGTAATVSVTTSANYFAPYTFTASGTAKSETASVEVLDNSVIVTTTGQQVGALIEQEPVALKVVPAGTTASSQQIWRGRVEFGAKKDGATFVFKMDGVESTIVADKFFYNVDIGFDQTTMNCGQSQNKTCTYFTIEENGYYYMYVNRDNVDDKPYSAITGFGLFATAGSPLREAVNENENATIQILGVFANNLTPTVNFRDEDGTLITTYTHKYTDYSGRKVNMSGDAGKGAILSAADIFALAQAAVTEGETAIELPTKTSDIPEVEYVFDGWVDAEGNPVDAVYLSGDVYASFKEVDNRTKYTVIFKNYDGETLYETVVPEGVVPEYPATLGTPKKPSTDTNSFEFIGWDPEVVAAPTTPEADGGKGADIVYTAQYKEIERRFDVIYYAEDGESVIYEALYLVSGTAAEFKGEIPTKAADVQYSYEFEKWVDLEGNDVDLTAVKADMKVKPAFKATLNKYTVTFMDGETELGKSTVDYGTAATAPEATKDADDNYTYAFDKWVDDKGNEADLTEIKGDITVFATFTATFTPKYTDLETMKPTDWYAPAVEYVLVNGIMNGMTANTFSLNTNMTRAMVVTVLYRYLGEPEVDMPDDYEEFVDNEDQSTWFYNAVVWAKVNNVVNGKIGNKFDPNGNVTREEFVVILYRFADQVMGEDVQCGRASVSGFADKDQISDWSRNAVKWAYATKDDLQPTIPGVIQYEKAQYINGKGTLDGKPLFAPKANATRAEVATMLFRYMTGERIAKAE